MYKQILRITFLTLGLILLSACATTQPVHNYNAQPIPSGLSDKQIQQAFQTAGAQRHWNISPVKTGLMVGTLNWHSHYVKINIPYTKSSYAIEYNDSYNLKYNNGKIHRNYNKWITLLNNDIQNQLIIQQVKNK